MPEDEDHVRDRIHLTEQALDDAVGAREADLSDVVVVNRLYYACFHAAQAVQQATAFVREMERLVDD